MNRSAFAPALALLLCVGVSASAFAQAQPAAPTTPAPADKAKFVTPIKGLAIIEVIQERSMFVGKEIVTVFKIRNISKAPIALLKVDEYWYDKAGKLVSSDTQRYKQPFAPGQIIEMKTRSPAVPGVAASRAIFAHANGAIKANAVKSFK
jgi:hypothetical protein